MRYAPEVTQVTHAALVRWREFRVIPSHPTVHLHHSDITTHFKRSFHRNQQNFNMAVVIKPTENRAVMAKPPPKKLDADAGERVRKEEQTQWSVRDPFSSITFIRNLGKRWKNMAKQ
ncbi:hypothetical protein HBI17_148710 [Parastagonospora nodorum]|nr:hypothetical protein HBI11_170480 [Parastagonospora nodorum]KAH5486292.1 hypothetical protein HBI31_151180 [Parastagonospora nodorum]KAH5744650.1 hypothetical protein HBI17_148710 [Parastagonospora nodorum]